MLLANEKEWEIVSVKLYREYKIKFYLNMRHYIIINGKKGETHPHTWEFALNIQFGRSSFVEFNTFERGIAEYLSKYQNKVLNEEAPFDSMLPTLENVTDYFSEEFYRIIYKIGGIMTRLEASETPTRSYIVSLEGNEENLTMAADTDKQVLSDVIDAVLDEIVE